MYATPARATKPQSAGLPDGAPDGNARSAAAATEIRLPQSIGTQGPARRDDGAEQSAAPPQVRAAREPSSRAVVMRP